MSSHKQRAAAKAAADTDPRCVWADYVAPGWKAKNYQRTEFLIEFEDGEVCRVTTPSHRLKPFNYGRASRVVGEFWRNRISSRRLRAQGSELEGEAWNRAKWALEKRLRLPAIVSIEAYTLE